MKMRHDPRRIVWLMATLLAVAGVQLWAQQVQQSQKKQQAKEIYTRPRPKRPIKPEIPSANRYQTDKVFLEQADSLFKRRPNWREEEHQVVSGNVKFRQGGMFMWCDSAYYFPDLNSLDAFGHVKMEQGDTLFAYADVLYYDGDERFARLRCGPTQKEVKLINREVTLTTDSLDYNVGAEIGWYEFGGKLEDDVNTLTSRYGEYSPATKQAAFYHDVVLRNEKDDFTLLTDTLYYDTETHIATIVSATRIYTPTDTILTRQGWYDTQTGDAELHSRSIVAHTDSLGRVTTLEGDSIVYDKEKRISRVYIYRGPDKMGAPMVITDTARKTILIGGFGEYNDSTREAFATEYPMMIDYSRGDSTFLRADTIESLITVRKVWPPGVLDSLLTARREARLLADRLAADSAAKSMIDTDSLKLKQEETVQQQPAAESQPASLMPSMMPEQNADDEQAEEPLDSTLMVDQEFHVAKAYRRARFFRQDLQGVADSMVYLEWDSTLYMIRKPIVWSGERQIYGNLIEVHFNDSTADRAYLPDYGMAAEAIEEDFYNQLSGKKMTAYLENESLKQLDVDGNVQVIFLPMENDSTYNKLVNAESSFLTADLEGQVMERLKMWPEVTGTVTPLFVLKDNQKTLQGFKWYEPIRPKRVWYGAGWKWDDELGEVPEELDQYFRSEETGIIGRRRLTKTASGEASVAQQPASGSNEEAEVGKDEVTEQDNTESTDEETVTAVEESVEEEVKDE